MSKIDDILHAVQAELGSDLVVTDVVGMDGLSIGGVSNPSNNSVVGGDLSALVARMTMVMSLAKKVGAKIKMGDIDNGIVTTSDSYIIMRFLGDGSYFWVMALTRAAVLGVVNMVFGEYEDQLWDAIPR